MSIIAAGTSSGTALVSTGDTNGTLVIQTNGTTVAATFGTDQSLTLVGALSAPSIAGNAVATQAQQETGTSTTVLVTPGRQQFHQSAAKAWAFVDMSGGTATLVSSYNVSSITDLGVGQIRFNITTAFSSGNWCALLTLSQESVGTTLGQWVSTPTTNAVDSYCVNVATTLQDPGALYFAGFGDQ